MEGDLIECFGYLVTPNLKNSFIRWPPILPRLPNFCHHSGLFLGNWKAGSGFLVFSTRKYAVKWYLSFLTENQINMVVLQSYLVQSRWSLHHGKWVPLCAELIGTQETCLIANWPLSCSLLKIIILEPACLWPHNGHKRELRSYCTFVLCSL